MLVETKALVSADKFREQMDKYIAAARDGSGPVGVTQDSEVVGFFISPQAYEAMFGAAVKGLLASRARGPSVPQGEAKARVQKITKTARDGERQEVPGARVCGRACFQTNEWSAGSER